MHVLLSTLLFVMFINKSFTQSTDSKSSTDTLRVTDLEAKVYSSTFKFTDGSELTQTSTVAVNAMIYNAKKLLAISSDKSIVNTTRELKDNDALKLVFLAVAGNFVVDHSESASLPQRCTLVVDPGSGGLILKDSSSTKSVILEVLVIVSIVCLLRAWDGVKG